MTRRLLVFCLALLVAFPARRGLAQTISISDPALFAKCVEAAQQTVDQYGRYTDPDAVARVNRIGYELAQQAGFDKFPFAFGILEMAVPNAEAMPGGQIFITRGMIDMGVDDDMLANVIGHEIGHVIKQHSLKLQRKAMLMNILSNILVAGVLIGADRGYHPPAVQAPYDPRVGYDSGNGNLVQGAAAVSFVVSELLLLKYSREDEDEADLEGQRMAAAAGYNPDGAQRLWDLMNRRMPEVKEYGYLRTHPFSEDRIRAAEARKGSFEVQKPRPADTYRQRTQDVLLAFAEHPPLKAKIEKARHPERKGPRDGAPPEEVERFERLRAHHGDLPYLKQASLDAWPKGKGADAIRLERLHQIRDREMKQSEMSRDYGALLTPYREQIRQVRLLDPRSELIPTLEKEVSEMDARRLANYPKAVEVLKGGVYETSFLASFVSNFPDVKETPQVAFLLGDAYSRLGNQTDAVTQYLAAWKTAPESAEGKRARTGLRILAPSLKELSALQELSAQSGDPEIGRVAGARLATMAKTYDELSNGADYLRRFPEGEQVVTVLERLNVLADNLYGEVVLYQGFGDPAKAVDRINKILTDAPLSPAAERLRDRAVFTESAAKAG